MIEIPCLSANSFILSNATNINFSTFLSKRKIILKYL
uniref:Uncharacterized protein n=1 Tax=Siphoviridae sp. ctbBv3 TaxID=2826392 RepID=A0A8S5NHD3_9CAUD|nr:MAG TPA: hypothetical protein [Siphoviridae sp. ctbBv3]DAF13158.1 MAG TPA: hypothetical protein [Caudoviricetes sp.]DAS98198.1 MAG TPA: hypothetical protein [Caudoviricetes sp.]DAX61822.1 MAG TPA: hypothetical protein [Caudoviricetes sp.]